MNIEQIRGIISAVYKSKSWQEKVRNMSDGQVFAIYKSFLAKGKIK